MFKKIKHRLTWWYSGVMMVVLLFFLFMIYFSFVEILYYEEKQELLAYGLKEKNNSSRQLLEWTPGKPLDIRREPGSNGFYYVFNNNGALVYGVEGNPELRKSILSEIERKKPKENQLFLFTMKNGRTLAIVGQEIIVEGKQLGLFFVGQDVTGIQHVFKNFLYVMAGIAFLFVIIAAVSGYFMAGKAIVPIIQSMERQKKFTADASHELRTPLGILLSSTEILEEEEKEKMSLFGQQLLDDMKQEIKRMSGLVSDLLMIARADSNQLQMDKKWIGVNELVSSIVRNIGYLAMKKKITLIFEQRYQGVIYVDKEKIQQVLYILLHNALNYTPQGGCVEFVVEKNKETGSANYIQFIVKDDGVGIPKEELSHIFQRFYRVEQSRTKKSGGTGLGLSIAHSIIQAHGGEITVESTIGKGSTFTIILPTSNHTIDV
ncbi:cell wall metabolism sensor histidine kinase WalK [Microaerobacter geothermalis]|uniref:sensor histidine kinase n=1 Tax=Microaerobacter geothermalis TaxID=674972 RepID=UPI001F422AFD|nr:ATP-binding protein [Microaerobacter geothermalis]MCF6092497.1 cell wall metabolism sensor histidine kinase WalK [Microaerobacter geothermalis]